jgi:AsmA protein
MNRRILIGLLAGLAVVIAAIVAVPFVVPTAALRGEIERRVTAQTGRNFRINGDLAFTVFPTLGLAAHDVTLANAPGGHARAMVEVEALRIGVKLMPLLSGRIEANGIELDRPRIALEVAHDGRANWQLAAHGGVGARAEAGVAAKTQFAGVTIKDGAVTYDNDRSNTHRAIDGLDAKVALTELDAPVGVTGTFGFRGRRLGYSVSARTIRALAEGKATRVNVALTSDFLNAGFIGDVQRDGSVTGYASLRTPSVKDVAAWFGHPVTAGRGLGALDARASVAAHDRSVSLMDIVAKLDGMNLKGGLDADLRADTPVVNGTIAIDRLDLNTYMQSAGATPTPGPPRPAAPNPPAGGWSKSPIKLDLIKLLNGRLTLNAGGVALLHLKLGKTTILATFADGLLTARMDPMQLYGGTGVATLTVDDRGPVPAVANTLAFTNIALSPFLADTIGVNKIDGRGNIALDVASKGASPDAVMRALAGKGAVAIGRGSIRGVDMGRVARTVTAILSAGATGDGATTDFDRFGGTFVLANGVLSNGDLILSSAFINMTGAGHLDLGNQTIAYRIEPKASIGGRMHLLDVGVPFAITGPWSRVSYVPDIAGAVTGLLGSVLSKGTSPITAILNGLTGNGQNNPAPDNKNKKKKNKSVGDRLKSMFGIH